MLACGFVLWTRHLGVGSAWLLVASCFVPLPEVVPGSCEPGAEVSCYTGPPGMLGVGECVGGAGICLADGEGVGECSGQVLPRIEQCVSGSEPADDDCNGVANESCANWSLAVGASVGTEAIEDVAVLPGDDILLVGSHSSRVDLGGGDIGAEVRDGFIGRLGPDGKHVWSVGARGPGKDALYLVSSLDDQDAVVVGTAGATEIRLAPLTVSTVAKASLLVGRISATDGRAIWLQAYGEEQRETRPLDMIVTGAGTIVVVGRFQGTLDFGDGVSIGPADGEDGFVVEMDANGNALWATAIGGAGDDACHAVTFDEQNRLYVGGEIAEQADAGCGVIDGGTNGFGGFVTRFDAPTGIAEPRLCGGQQLLSSERARVTALAYRAGYGLLVGAEVEGAIELGGVALPAGDGLDMVVARLDPDGLEAIWTQRFGAPGSAQSVWDVLVTEGEQAVVAASIAGGPDLGAGPHEKFDEASDALWLILDTDGTPLLSRSFGGLGDDDGYAAAVDSAGRLWLTGEFEIGIDFGFENHEQKNPSIDGFVARFDLDLE